MHGDLIVRLFLVLAAGTAVVIGAPVVMSSLLGLAAMIAVAQRANIRRRGTPDSVLVGTAGTLIAFMVIGLALDLTGVRIESDAWIVALGCLSVLILVLAELNGPPPPRMRVRSAPGLLVWLCASVAVAAGAVALSVVATDRDSMTPLELSLDASGTSVIIATEQGSGPLELSVRPLTGRTTRYEIPQLEPGARKRIPIQLPVSGRVMITLTNPGQTVPLRSLIIDRGTTG